MQVICASARKHSKTDDRSIYNRNSEISSKVVVARRFFFFFLDSHFDRTAQQVLSSQILSIWHAHGIRYTACYMSDKCTLRNN